MERLRYAAHAYRVYFVQTETQSQTFRSSMSFVSRNPPPRLLPLHNRSHTLAYYSTVVVLSSRLLPTRQSGFVN